MRRMLTISAITLTSAAMGTVPAAATSASPQSVPDSVVVEVVTVNGSGCRAGTAAVTEDNMGFKISYKDFTATTGKDSDPIEIRKNCQINLIVHAPQEYTYAIGSAQYNGFAHLLDGARGEHVTHYYFQGLPGSATKRHPINGPYSDHWTFTDTVDPPQQAYKPCGENRNLNINAELRVDAGTSDPAGTSYMTMDSTSGEFNSHYRFAWKRC